MAVRPGGGGAAARAGVETATGAGRFFAELVDGDDGRVDAGVVGTVDGEGAEDKEKGEGDDEVDGDMGTGTMAGVTTGLEADEEGVPGRVACGHTTLFCPGHIPTSVAGSFRRLLIKASSEMWPVGERAVPGIAHAASAERCAMRANDTSPGRGSYSPLSRCCTPGASGYVPGTGRYTNPSACAAHVPHGSATLPAM